VAAVVTSPRADQLLVRFARHDDRGTCARLLRSVGDGLVSANRKPKLLQTVGARLSHRGIAERLSLSQLAPSSERIGEARGSQPDRRCGEAQGDRGSSPRLS